MTKRLILSMVAAGCVMLPAVSAAQTSGGGSGRGTAAPPKVMVPAPVDPKLGPQAFSVVLVVGEVGNAAAVDNVPPAARKALNDMKDFLPYKSYRLLDTQWTLCCGRETTPIYSRLRGLDDQEYELRVQASVIQTSTASAPTVVVREFWLSETPYRNAAELANLRKRLEAGKNVTDEERKIIEGELAVGARRSSNRTIMNASFSMEVGETVVVGTSRIHGDKALIALLTAVPPKK
jgi:hypothetical protein